MNQNLLFQLFQQQFQHHPKWISFAPGRVNLIGEHVDYLGGRVNPAAVEQGVAFVARPIEQSIWKIYSRDFDEMIEWSKESLADSKQSSWKKYVWSVFKRAEDIMRELPMGLEILIMGDIPQGAGMSSSAALEVAGLQLLTTLQGHSLTKQDLALEAQKVENIYVGTQCGIMDQFASVHGREGHFINLDCSTLEYELYRAETPGCDWVLVNSMVKHSLGDNYNTIREELESARDKLGCESLMALCPDDIERARGRLTDSEFARALYATGEKQRTTAFMKAATNYAVGEMGQLLCETHWGLSEQMKISTPELDAIVEFSGHSPHWLGGRLMGGGFGGCVINLVKSEGMEDYLTELKDRFQEKFGMIPEHYPVKLSDGARIQQL